MSRSRPPGTFVRHSEGHDIDTSSDAILYALFIEAPLHLYHLAVLVAAIAGALVLQCLMLGWIALYYAQVRVFLLSAKVLRDAFPDGARLAVGVSGGNVGPEVERSVAPEQKNDEEVMTARERKEEAARLRRVKPPTELAAIPNNSKARSTTVMNATGAQPKHSKPIVSEFPQITSILDKLRDAARATGARRGKPARSFSPISNPEPDAVKEASASNSAQLVPEGLFDWTNIAARDAESNLETLKLDEDENHNPAGHGEQGEQPRHKWKEPVSRPFLRLPNNRPPKPKPQSLTFPTQVNQTYAQATTTVPPLESKPILHQPLNRSAAFTQEQLAAAREFMSGATRGNIKSRPKRSNVTHHPKPPAQKGAQFIHKLKQQAQLNRRLRSEEAIVQVEYVPATLVERPPGWVPPHIAAAKAKAANNPFAALEDHLQETKSEASHKAAGTEPRWEKECDDHTEAESNLSEADVEPASETNFDPVEDAPASADLTAESTRVEDQNEDPPTEVEPPVANDGFAATTITEETRQTQAVEPEIVASEQPQAADVYDTLLEPQADGASDHEPSEPSSGYDKSTKECSLARLRLFAKGDDDPNGLCFMCDKIPVRDRGNICFPCSTVAARIDDVKELLAPYTAETIIQGRFPVQKSATPGSRRFNPKKAYQEVRKEQSDEDLENALFTVEEDNSTTNVYKSHIKESSYEHPDLSDLQSDFSDNTPLVRQPKPTQPPVQARKLSANGLPFFAPLDKDFDKPQLTSSTNRSISHKVAHPIDAHDPYTAFFGTFPKTIDESPPPRPRSSLSQSRWAPRNPSNIGQQHSTSGSPRAFVRTAPNMDTLFGPALSKFQSDPAQISIPKVSPMPAQKPPRVPSSIDAQSQYMLYPTSQQTFAVEDEHYPFDVGSMRLPPGLPVPEHVKKSIRLSKAVPITKPTDNGESNVRVTVVPSSENYEPRNKGLQHCGSVFFSMFTDPQGPSATRKTETGTMSAGIHSISQHEMNFSQDSNTEIATKKGPADSPPSIVIQDQSVPGSAVPHRRTRNTRPDPANATSTKPHGDKKVVNGGAAITKPSRLRKMAREAITDAFRKRELVRIQLIGSWNLEKAHELEAATEKYNSKRQELAALTVSGKLSDEDAVSFPEFSGAHISAPRVRIPKARKASGKDEIPPTPADGLLSAAVKDNSPIAESSSPETPMIPGSALTNKDVDEPAFPKNSTAAQIEAQTKARAAFDLLVTAMKAWTMSQQICLKCNMKSCGDHQAAKGKSRIGPAKSNYRRRREALVQAYGDELPIWLADALPDPQELELHHEKEGCSVM